MLASIKRVVRRVLGAAGAETGAAAVDTPRFDANLARVLAQLAAMKLPVRPAESNAAVRAALEKSVEALAREHTGAELRVLGAAAFSGSDGAEARDVTKAVRLWVAAGMRGDAEAIYSIAQCLLTGVGMEADPVRAGVILDELILAGHAWAHFSRGVQLASAHAANPAGPECARAFELMKVAAQKGVSPAFLNVANMLEVRACRYAVSYAGMCVAECTALLQGGIGTQRDEEASTEWFVSAARRGDPRAQVAPRCHPPLPRARALC